MALATFDWGSRVRIEHSRCVRSRSSNEVVKWLDDEKGYWFVLNDATSDQVHVNIAGDRVSADPALEHYILPRASRGVANRK
jgi:hypothetical protein